MEIFSVIKTIRIQPDGKRSLSVDCPFCRMEHTIEAGRIDEPIDNFLMHADCEGRPFRLFITCEMLNEQNKLRKDVKTYGIRNQNNLQLV